MSTEGAPTYRDMQAIINKHMSTHERNKFPVDNCGKCESLNAKLNVAKYLWEERGMVADGKYKVARRENPFENLSKTPRD